MDRTLGAGFQTIGGKRFFQDENLGASIQGSDVDEIFLNALQETVIAVSEQVGITPANATEGSPDFQLLQGVRRVASANITTVTAASTTLTPDNAGLVMIDATAHNVSVTLPLAASANGQALNFTFLRVDTSGNAVTIVMSGSDKWQPGTVAGTYSPASGETFAIQGNGSSGWNVLQRTPLVFVFNSGGTLTIPVGVTAVDVELVGGGGGGVGSNGSGTSGGCGGAAGYSRKRIQGLVPGSTITVTVGAGGSGSAWATNAGNGASSSFGSFCSATGGQGGQWTSSTSSAGGNPGVGSGGDINLSGGWGSDGTNAGAIAISGQGGVSFFGGGGRMAANGGSPANGSAPGSGGAGSYFTSLVSNGGNGATGIVVVRLAGP